MNQPTAIANHAAKIRILEVVMWHQEHRIEELELKLNRLIQRSEHDRPDRTTPGD